MSVQELLEYLSGFDPDDQVAVLALDLKTRHAYKPDAYQLMTDAGLPVLLFEVGDGVPLEELVEQAGEESSND